MTPNPRETGRRRARLVEICASLPICEEADAEMERFLYRLAADSLRRSTRDHDQREAQRAAFGIQIPNCRKW